MAEAPLPNINEIKDGLSNVERLENRISMLTGNKNFVWHLYAMKKGQANAMDQRKTIWQNKRINQRQRRY